MTRPRDILRALRDEALKRGHLFYEGSPCTKCKGTKRYSSSCNCAKCLADKNAEYRARVARMRENSRLGPAVYEKHYAPRLLKPWPASCSYENITPPPFDGIPYHAAYSTQLRYASSANDVAEMG